MSKKIQVLSDNRIYIDGKQAEKLNTIAKEFIVNKAIKSDAEKIVTSSGNFIKNELGEGSFETGDYTFDIIKREGSLSIDAKTLETLYPEVFEDSRLWVKHQDTLVLKSVQAKV